MSRGRAKKDLSTKGHEGPRRATKALVGVREGLPRIGKGGVDGYEGWIREKELSTKPFARFVSKRDLLPGRIVPPGSAGVPPAQCLAQPWPSPPLGLTRNCAVDLLRARGHHRHRSLGRSRAPTDLRPAEHPLGRPSGRLPAQEHLQHGAGGGHWEVRCVSRGRAKKDLSSKGHEGPRRATKALVGVREGLPRIGKGGVDGYEGWIREKELSTKPFARFVSKRDLLPGRVVPPGSAGVPPAQCLAQPWPSPPLGLTRNCAVDLLRFGR